MTNPMFSIKKYQDEKTPPDKCEYSVCWYPKIDFLGYLNQWFEILLKLGIDASSIVLESNKNETNNLKEFPFNNKNDLYEKLKELRSFKEDEEYNYFILINVNNFVFECFVNGDNIIVDYVGVVFLEDYMGIFMDWILKDILKNVTLAQHVNVKMEIMENR